MRSLFDLKPRSISALGVGVYTNALETPFVFDSIGHISQNSNIRITTLDFEELRGVVLETRGPRARGRASRPVAFLSLALNYYFGKYEVFGYHAVNVAIHIVNGILVYLLAQLAFRQGTPLASLDGLHDQGT